MVKASRTVWIPDADLSEIWMTSDFGHSLYTYSKNQAQFFIRHVCKLFYYSKLDRSLLKTCFIFDKVASTNCWHFCFSEAFDLRHEIRESSSHAEAEEFAQNGDDVSHFALC